MAKKTASTKSFLALITPLSATTPPGSGGGGGGAGDAHPEHPIVLPPTGSPWPPSDAHPEHPIFLPPESGSGGDAHPEHPIYIPVDPPEGGGGAGDAHPSHPIYIPVFPSHPIVLPPIDAGHPSHPINQPPNNEPGWAFVFVPGQGWSWIQFTPGAPKPPAGAIPKR